MNLVISLYEIIDVQAADVGGKGLALSTMARNGINVPKALCISSEAYPTYVSATGLRGQILMELQMRWTRI